MLLGIQMILLKYLVILGKSRLAKIKYLASQSLVPGCSNYNFLQDSIQAQVMCAKDPSCANQGVQRRMVLMVNLSVLVFFFFSLLLLYLT